MSTQTQSKYPVFIPPLAFSRRTSGFRFIIVDEQGLVLYEGRTSKKSIYVELPSEPRWLIVFYKSYSGHRYLNFYEFQRNPDGVLRPKKKFSISDMEDFLDKILALGISDSLKEKLIFWLSR